MFSLVSLPCHQLQTRPLCLSPQLHSLTNHPPQYLVSRFSHVHCQILTVILYLDTVTEDTATQVWSCQVLSHGFHSHSQVLFCHNQVFFVVIVILFCIAAWPHFLLFFEINQKFFFGNICIRVLPSSHHAPHRTPPIQPDKMVKLLILPG